MRRRWRAIGFALLCFALAFGGLFVARRLPGRPVLGVLLIALPLTFDLSINNAPNQSTALPPQTYDVLREATSNETIRFLKDKLAENGPDRRDRVELAAIDFHWPNAGLTHGFDMSLGYNPIRLQTFIDVTRANDHVAVPEQRVFSPAFPSYKSPMANLFGLRWIATGVPVEQIDKNLKPGDLPLVKQTADAFIYENKDALPRVLAPGRAVVADFAALADKGGVPDLDYRKNVLLDRADCARLGRVPGAAGRRGGRSANRRLRKHFCGCGRDGAGGRRFCGPQRRLAELAGGLRRWRRGGAFEGEHDVPGGKTFAGRAQGAVSVRAVAGVPAGLAGKGLTWTAFALRDGP